MSRPNLPRKDSEAASWMRNFARKLVDDPEAAGVSPSQAAEVEAKVAAFRAALAVTLTPSLSTRSATIAKRSARAAAEAVCRRFYVVIKRNPELSNEFKVGLGIRPDKRHRSRIGRPTTAPLLYARRQGESAHRFHYTDSASAYRTAKPAGVAMIQLARVIAETPQPSPLKAHLYNVYTSSRFTVTYTPDEAGKVVTYFARWASPTGVPGPWSQPLVLAIPAQAPFLQDAPTPRAAA